MSGLEGVVFAGLEFVDTALIDIEADYMALESKFDGKREADITKTYDGKFDVL